MLTDMAVFITQAVLHFLGLSDLELGRNQCHRRSKSLTGANQFFHGKDPNTFNFSLFDSLVLFKMQHYLPVHCDFSPASFSFWGKTFQPALKILRTQLTDGLG